MALDGKCHFCGEQAQDTSAMANFDGIEEQIVNPLRGVLEKLAKHPAGSWMSAALEDPNTCDECKRDFQQWFDDLAAYFIPESLDRDTMKS